LSLVRIRWALYISHGGTIRGTSRDPDVISAAKVHVPISVDCDGSCEADDTTGAAKYSVVIGIMVRIGLAREPLHVALIGADVFLRN
jgi:hypothetical protein